MEIKRYGEKKDRGTTTLLKESAITKLRFDRSGNLEVIFNNVKLPSDTKTHHEYVVTLTPDDLGKILAEAIKQAFTKSK